MNVVICALNSQYIHSSLAPWCLLAGIREYGSPALQVQVIEGTVNEDMETVAQRIINAAPDCVGFCCYIWNITRVKELLPRLKAALPNLKIVLGGPEVGYCAPLVLEENPQADYVLTGEGERSFAMLCNRLLQGGDPLVCGATCRVKGEIVSMEEEPPMEEPPTPYCDEYFASLKGRIAYLETSRGCPYACAYCLSARCGKLRFYSMERVKKELLLLANSGTKTVKLVDRTFNAHRQRAKDLWRFIIAHYGAEIPEGVCFHFEIAGDLLDEESIEIIGSAPVGSMQFEVGIQSFHEPTLAYIHRKTDLEKLTLWVGRLIALGNVHVHIDLIAGLPLEDYATFGQSVNRAYAMQANMLQLGFLKMLHGAPMREEAERYPCTFHSEPPYQVIETPALSAEELARLQQTEWALDKLYNSGRFRRTLAYLLPQSGLTPFAWFTAFGSFVSQKEGASLERVAQRLFDFALQQKAEERVVRDLMVQDWLSTVKGGKLPAFLQVKDPRMSTFRKWLRQSADHGPKSGIPRGVAVLYAPLRGVYVDYETPHKVTGEYPLQIVSWEQTEEQK